MPFSAIGQTFTRPILAGCIAYPSNKSAGYIATVDLFALNTFAGIGFDGILFLHPVELTPLKTRGRSVAIATGCFWLCIMISPVLIENIKFGTYVLWCATNFSFISLIYFFILETSNAALQDIDDLFKTSRTWVIGTSSRRKLRDIVTARQAPEKGNREELHFEADKSRVVIIEGNGAGSLMNDNPEAHLQGIIEESDIIRRISEQVCLLKRGSL